MAIYTKEQQALILLEKIIEQAELERQHLNKNKSVDASNLLISIGKLISVSAKLEVEVSGE